MPGKISTQKFFSDCHFEEVFWNNNGRLINNIPELIETIDHMDDFKASCQQGQQLAYSTPYNLTVHYGQKNGTAIGHGWVGGLSSADFNLSCNYTYAQKVVIDYVNEPGGATIVKLETYDQNNTVVKYIHKDYLGSISLETDKRNIIFFQK